MRLSFSASIIFLYFFLIKTSICFLGHGNCETSLSKANGDCDASEKIKTDSDLVSADNAYKHNVGISETRVTMSRYHLGTENSRIYKERSSKRSAEHTVRGFRNGLTYPMQQRYMTASMNERRTLRLRDMALLGSLRLPTAFSIVESMPDQLEQFESRIRNRAEDGRSMERRSKIVIRRSKEFINDNQEYTKRVNQEMIHNADRHAEKRQTRRSTSFERVPERTIERMTKELSADERSLRNARYSHQRDDAMHRDNITERKVNNDRQRNRRALREMHNSRTMSRRTGRGQRLHERRARELHNERSSRNERSLEPSIMSSQQELINSERPEDRSIDSIRQHQEKNRQVARNVYTRDMEDVGRISAQSMREYPRKIEILPTNFIRQNDARSKRLQERYTIDRYMAERITGQRVRNERIASTDKMISNLNQRSETIRNDATSRQAQDFERRVEGSRAQDLERRIVGRQSISVSQRDHRLEHRQSIERRILSRSMEDMPTRILPLENRKTERLNVQRDDDRSVRERQSRRQLMKQDRFQDERRSLDSLDRFAEQRLIRSGRLLVNDRTFSKRLDATREIRNEFSAKVERKENRDSRQLRRGARVFSEASNTDHSFTIGKVYTEISAPRGWLLNDSQLIQIILLTMITMRILYDALDVKSKMKMKHRFGNATSFLKHKLL